MVSLGLERSCVTKGNQDCEINISDNIDKSMNQGSANGVGRFAAGNFNFVA